MSKSRPFVLVFALLLASPSAFSQAQNKATPAPDYAQAGTVIEQSITRVGFNSDGTSSREQSSRIRIQSEAGAQQFGVLSFPYEGAFERAEIGYVRVKKPDGSVVTTPPDSFQDVTSEISRQAPFYTDQREKHIAVKGLSAGDTLEYAATWHVEKALAPNQFWYGYNFVKHSVALDEQLEISAPRERQLNVKSTKLSPTVREEGGRRIYTWKSSHLADKLTDDEEQELGYQSARGTLPAPDVLVSSFQSWDEVGRWFLALQQEKVQATPEIRAKAEELTKGRPTDLAKLQAVYQYVSQQYRYIGIALGMGRYQPHAASEILGNQYGDCKDKHTLLASLLSAVGISAYPALINIRGAIEKDLPSPSQFDHVISLAVIGKDTYWMDTTAELAPFGQLISPLRGKPALVLHPNLVAFETTPSDPAMQHKEEFQIAGKLSPDGTFSAHGETKVTGDDNELLVRLAFRRVPQSQWKELVQNIVAEQGFGGTVSEVEAGVPENINGPFDFSFNYDRKDYSDWENRRILAALPTLALPVVKDNELNRKIPLWLGSPGEWIYESRIELPKEFRAETPAPLTLREDFAEFTATSEIRDGILVTRRHLLIKQKEISPAQLKAYKTFQKAVWDDQFNYIQLKSTTEFKVKPPSTQTSGTQQMLDAMKDLPSSAVPEAVQAESDGRSAAQMGDLSSAAAAFKQAVTLDTKFARAWVELGATQMGRHDVNAAVDAVSKAVQADPQRPVTYKILAFFLTEGGRRTEAIATWQKLAAIDPKDHDVTSNLGNLYMVDKRYKEAAQMFEAATKTYPYNANMQMRLGVARIHAGDNDGAVAAFRRAMELDPGAETLNDVGYEMAEAGIDLPTALQYAQRAVNEVEGLSHKINPDNIQSDDLQISRRLASYWDTVGWIYYKTGDLSPAEKYLSAAWQLLQDGTIADHLGQVYEKEGKPSAAVHMYSLALEVNPHLEETPARMRRLARAALPGNRMSAGEELSRMRTVKLPKIINGTASAEFYVLLGLDRVNGVSFLRGSEQLRFADDSLQKAPFKTQLPPGSAALLLRQGILSCSSYTGCTFVFYPLPRPNVPN